jgi:AcrR family transcriptional regulator
MMAPRGAGQRDALLAGAVDHVLHHGVATLSLRPLAAALGTSDRMLLYYFGTREALLDAVLGAAGARLRDRLEAALPARPLPPDVLFDHAWRLLTEPAADGFLRLAIEISGLAARGQEPFRTAAAAVFASWREWLAARVDAPEAERAAAAAGVLAVLDGLLLTRFVAGDAVAARAAGWLRGALAPAPDPATPPGGAPGPTGPVVMIVRHGEKPDGDRPGVDAAGRPDDDSLTARGWERAHALVGLFGPARGGAPSGLPRPTAIHAAGATDAGEGLRTRQTVTPLADALGLPVDTDLGRGQERKLARDVARGTGVTLICWQHGGIPAIVDAFPHVRPDPPGEWPDDRFDLVWVLTRTADGWAFTQVPQRVLPGDRAEVVDR